MHAIGPDDLCNDLAEVLRRVESGEEIAVIVDGRPVARLGPVSGRPRFLPWEQVVANQADPGLLDDLREMLGDETTDDMVDPWERYS